MIRCLRRYALHVCRDNCSWRLYYEMHTGRGKAAALLVSRWPAHARTSRSVHSQTKSRWNVCIISSVTGLMSLFGVWFLYRSQNYKTHSKRDPDLKDILKNPLCVGNSGTLIRIGQYWLPYEFFNKTSKATDIQNFEIRDEDVIVGSFPKSGTTWVQEIVFLILNGADIADAQTATIEERFPYIEYVYPGLSILAGRPSPRYMKTHLPWSLLPSSISNGRGKVIYIARNPKDVAVSYFHFVKMLAVTQYKGHFYDFYEDFIEGRIAYGPWDKHVSEFWLHRDQDNVLFITYEDLHKDTMGMIQRLATFLGRSLTDEQIAKIARHCSFRCMKENPMVNYSWWKDIGLVKRGQTQFMRKGTVGDWTHYFSQDMCSTVDRVFSKPLEEQGLRFADELNGTLPPT